MAKKILIVDDDPSVCRLLSEALRKNGYEVQILGTGEEALAALEQKSQSGQEQKSPDGLILDIVLPGIDGLEVLKRIRSHPDHQHLPVILLTEKDGEVETVVGLEMGADEYLSKPIRYQELMTRLKKLLRASEVNSNPVGRILRARDMALDLDQRTATIHGKPVSFSYLEFELMALFLRNPGKVFSRSELLDKLWEDLLDLETRTVDVHVRRLRKKLEENGQDPSIIDTVRSVGYRLRP